MTVWRFGWVPRGPASFSFVWRGSCAIIVGGELHVGREIVMPRFSVVVPAFNGAAHIAECLESVLSQGVDDLEVIVADDRSSDETPALVRALAERDPRVRLVERAENGGTLRARRDGVLASTGDYVLLVDQDDALAPGALEEIEAALTEHDPDILHFGVSVIAENAAAEDAAAGMTGFLTPPSRRLEGEKILQTQFSGDLGFDWHVHHKAYRGELARRAWSAARDVWLTLSDDLYASFLLCSMASTYVAVPDAPWYEYHLGRGETFGARLTFEDVLATSERDHAALTLIEEFARSGVVSRDDWPARVADVRDRLIEHVMNELHDGLSAEEQRAAIDGVLSLWPADAVAGELYRFVRDRAYALFDARTCPKSSDELHRLLADARRADELVSGPASPRHAIMKEAAERHLGDLESLKDERSVRGVVRHLLARLRTR